MAKSSEAVKAPSDEWVDSPLAIDEISRTIARVVALVAAPAAFVMLGLGVATGELGAIIFAANGLAVSIGAAWILRTGSRRLIWLFTVTAAATLVGGIFGDDHFVLGTALAIGSAQAAMFLILSRVSKPSPIALLLTFLFLSAALLEHAPETSTLIGIIGSMVAGVALLWAGERFGADHRRRTELFHAMVDRAPSGMILLRSDSSREVLHANARAQDLLGARLVGQPLPEGLDEGSVSRLELSRAVIEGAEAEVLHLRDVSEVTRALERVEASEERYRLLFDRIPVGLYTTSVDGRILQGNAALAAVLGVDDPTSLPGRSVENFYVDPEDRLEHATRINEFGSATAEYRIVGLDGRERWVRDHCSIAQSPDGTVSYYGEMSDITEERLAQEQLEDTLRAREQLIGAVSHELRTPLTAVLGLVRLLEAGEVSDAEVAGVLDVVLSQTEDLHYIVEDLLAATRLSQGTLAARTEPFEVSSQVSAVFDSLEFQNQAISVSVTPGLIALGDEPRVRQILRNLLTNARKYGGPDIRIEAARAADGVEVVVADSGRGLAEGAEEEAFAPYTRLEEAGDHGSLGLGLHLSRGLAESMGGSLEYRRNGSGWTEFVLVLPFP